MSGWIDGDSWLVGRKDGVVVGGGDDVDEGLRCRDRESVAEW